ncbi:hypothetical protein K458DRAFT_89652 [Lentithecium fluviatile CBS 122367]|uniref:Uncharacterized protein n=1 Tax=Lentithecium fluviatile CBS 122367 TaxID=1168545 RepID=A0A6G1ISH5_9PLEO|nr:hypothetical protein K458DRAFT_89652 [Lentithecium fluviatile CBS 122367]
MYFNTVPGDLYWWLGDWVRCFEALRRLSGDVRRSDQIVFEAGRIRIGRRHPFDPFLCFKHQFARHLHVSTRDFSIVSFVVVGRVIGVGGFVSKRVERSPLSEVRGGDMRWCGAELASWFRWALVNGFHCLGSELVGCLRYDGDVSSVAVSGYAIVELTHQ